jgi:uncharacterized membrane protein
VPDSVNPIIQKNIRRILMLRREEQRQASPALRFANAIGDFAGSYPFLVIHAVIFGLWVLINGKVLPIIKPWDPYPFVMLAMAASVEAIFLSTFVLITQNRQAVLADKRAEFGLANWALDRARSHSAHSDGRRVAQASRH